MSNVISSGDWVTKSHFLHRGFSTTIHSSFISPSPTTHVSCPGDNVLSCSPPDHIRHVGFSATIESSYCPEVWGWYTMGIGWDGVNSLSSDYCFNRYGRHVGWSKTIDASFGSPGAGPRGVAWDGTDFLAIDTGIHYKYSGFSSSLYQSYVAPGGMPSDLDWTGTDIVCNSFWAEKHYLLVGFSSTVQDSHISPDPDPSGIAWGDPVSPPPAGNVLSADIGTGKHYRHVAFSDSIESSYSSPGSNPVGITWDGDNVLSTDSVTTKHYRHEGFSDSIESSFATPGPNPVGLSWAAWNGSALHSADADTLKIYDHAGFSSSINDSITTPGPTPRGIVWDETPSVISMDAFYDKCYQHWGFSETINVSYNAPGSSPWGVTWTGTWSFTWSSANLISADDDADKHYAHETLTSTITDSYSSPGSDPTGITYDGRYPIPFDPGPPPYSPVDVISADANSDMHYHHIDFTASISSSYSSPGTWPWGIGWDDTNVISVDALANKHYKHELFSDTIDSSYTSPNDYPTGITWDSENVISAGHGTTDKHYRHVGFSASILGSYVSPGVQPTGITWDGSNVLSADNSALKHYRHEGFSSSIESSYDSPSGYPKGMTWEGINVLSADTTLKHFRHVGFSNTVESSYLTPNLYPTGMTWGGPYITPEPPEPPDPDVTGVISANFYTPSKHYVHQGFSDSIVASYNAPSSYAWGITTDGENVLSVTSISNKHFKHFQFSDTITDSYATPGTYARGIAWEGDSVTSSVNNIYYRHLGFSSTITNSFATGRQLRGVTGSLYSAAYKGTSFWYKNKHLEHAGFSGTIVQSYSTESFAYHGEPLGMGWAGGAGLVSVNIGYHWLHDGFSATITGCYSSPDGSPTGIDYGTVTVAGAPEQYEVFLAGTFAPTGEVFKKTNKILTGAITFVGLLSRTMKFARTILEGAITFIGTLTTDHDQLGNERRITQVLVEVDQDVTEERRATQLVLEVDLEEEPASIAPIDLEDYLAYMDIDSLEITEGLGPYGDSCFFTVTIPNSLIPLTISKPKSGSPVVITLYSIVYFKGIIGTVTEEPVNPEVTRYSCDCTDFTRWLDRKLILADRPEELAGERIEALVDWIGTYLSGFPFDDFTYVSDGFDVEAASYDYIILSSILDEVAEACHYQWYVDFEKKIHFFDLEETVSPLNTDYGNLLDLDDPGNLDIGDVVISEDVTQLKNRVYIKGYAEKGDIKYPDGPYPPIDDQSFYKLYQEPWDWESTEVAVSGEDVLEGLEHGTRVVSLDPLDGAADTLIGQAGAAYICIFNMGVRFPSADLPDAHFTVWYYPALPDRVSTYEDVYSIEFMANREGSSGVHEFLVSVPHFRVETVERVGAIGEYLLRRYAWPYRSGSFTTLTFPHVPERLGLPGWHPGQYFRLTSDSRDIYDYEIYWKSGQVNKYAVTMYVLRVTRNFAEVRDEIGGVTLMVKEAVEFANQPYPL